MKFYSLGNKTFETGFNLLFAASKYFVAIGRQRQFKFFKMAERSPSFSGETLPDLCARKKRLQKKMTKGYYLIGAKEDIGMFSKS